MKTRNRFEKSNLINLVFLLAISGSWALSSGASDSHHAPKGIAPEEALQSLKDGNKRYIEGKSGSENQDSPARRLELVSGQKPKAIVLSCSDSRVPPEILFRQGLGDIFTVRVAGNVLGAATVASIEYAVEHLGSRLIVVMGHESCGAVKAAIQTARGKTAGSADLDSLVSSIQIGLDSPSGTPDRALASQKDDASDRTLRKPVMRNVDYVAQRLISRSTIIRKAVESGQVRVVPAIYSLESGMVDFWEGPKSQAKEKSAPAAESAHH